MTRENPYVPRPREAVLPNGELAVVGNRQLSNDAVAVPGADRPLYELLMEILEDCHIPDTMPANLAVACRDLVDVRETVSHPERGSVRINGPAYGLSYLNQVREAVARYRDRDPLQLVAVGCSGSKYDTNEPVPAKDLYKGAYWSNKQQYGENCADSWRIISAKHGVLNPKTQIHWYERTPSDLRDVPVQSDQRLPSGDLVETLLDQWALSVYEGLSEWIASLQSDIDPRDIELEILLGTSYRDPLEDRGVFEELRSPGALSITFPYQDNPEAQGGMFEQIGWMSDQVAAASSSTEESCEG